MRVIKTGGKRGSLFSGGLGEEPEEGEGEGEEDEYAAGGGAWNASGDDEEDAEEDMLAALGKRSRGGAAAGGSRPASAAARASSAASGRSTVTIKDGRGSSRADSRAGAGGNKSLPSWRQLMDLTHAGSPAAGVGAGALPSRSERVARVRGGAAETAPKASSRLKSSGGASAFRRTVGRGAKGAAPPPRMNRALAAR